MRSLSPGRNGIMADVSTSPLPSAFATTTLPARTASTSPATPRKESGAQFHRIAEPRIHAAQDHIDTVQSCQRFEKYVAIANGEVGALHERKSEVTRQIGMLEIGLVQRPGRQQHDLRIVRSARATGSSGSLGTRGKNEASRLT